MQRIVDWRMVFLNKWGGEDLSVADIFDGGTSNLATRSFEHATTVSLALGGKKNLLCNKLQKGEGRVISGDDKIGVFAFRRQGAQINLLNLQYFIVSRLVSIY